MRRLIARARGLREVKMAVSVAGIMGEYVAGECYFLPPEEADALIAKRYAYGVLSRVMTPEEIESLSALDQEVSV